MSADSPSTDHNVVKASINGSGNSKAICSEVGEIGMCEEMEFSSLVLIHFPKEINHHSPKHRYCNGNKHSPPFPLPFPSLFTSGELFSNESKWG